MRLLFTAIAALLPRVIGFPLLRVLGHRIHPRARIGFSLVLVGRLWLDDEARIGHLNLIRCRRVVLRKRAYIRLANMIRGPISVIFQETAGIGGRNEIVRAKKPISYGPAQLRLGVYSKITGLHYIDCTRSIVIGDYSIVAGVRSQLWTHGYYHEASGPGRFRVDGGIVIGNNVYIGSGSVISMGVRIADAAIVGSHSSVSKSLDQAGLYVCQPLRHVESSAAKVLANLEPVRADHLSERVYRKPGVR